MKPHPDEVDDTKWVTQSQLLTMFNDKSLLFSPWFRLITNKWMIGSNNKTGDDDKEGVNGGKGGWWDDLSRTMNTNDFIDYETIHTFDPPAEHMGGGGDAGPMFSGNENDSIVGDSS